MDRPTAASFTIDIDTGGTFTDAYVASRQGGVQVKADTTPHDLREGIMACIDRAAEVLGTSRRGLLGATETVRLSTTIGTNALITGSGARVGLLLAESLFADLAESLPREVPLQADLIAAVGDGEASASSPSAMTQVKHLLERGARILVVALDGPTLAIAENALRELIASEHPRHYLGTVPVLASHQVSRTPDAGARVRTAVLNAYLHPLMARFLYRVEDELRREGYRHPLLIANADGGSSRVAKTTAIRTWGSGPAGAVAGAAHLAETFGSRHLVTLDVGGTSSDIAVVGPGTWHYVVEPEIEGARVAIPLLELESVGIGGGSIVRVTDGRITVGPESAGAQPGPAAYGLGGDAATVTDAFCCAGVFDPEHFLAGRKKLDLDAAERVLTQVAAEAGTSLERAVAQVVEVAARTVAGRIVALLRRWGHEPADAELLLAGGAGGLLGCSIAAAAGLAAARAVPMTPVFSAFGLGVLDRVHVYELPAEVDHLAEHLDRTLERARTDMRGEGIDPASLRFELEIETGADGDVVARSLGCIDDGPSGADLLRAASEPARLIRLRAISPVEPAPLPKAGSREVVLASGAPLPRLATWNGVSHQSETLAWASLEPGQRLQGPSIVESDYTTLLLPPGFSASVGPYGDLLITGERHGN